MQEAQQWASSGQCMKGVHSRHRNTPTVNVNDTIYVNRRQQKNWIRVRSFRRCTKADDLVWLIDGRGDKMNMDGGIQLCPGWHEEVVLVISDWAANISNRMCWAGLAGRYGETTYNIKQLDGLNTNHQVAYTRMSQDLQQVTTTEFF